MHQLITKEMFLPEPGALSVTDVPLYSSGDVTMTVIPAVVPEGYLRPALQQDKQAAVCAFP
ncbi:TPA: hypothetical protein MO343_004854 [Salmonella enterica subsp. enterica serovar Ball]|nr:hypothetical protein [Salmonella enterica subsp. enterica serovar Ball]HCA3582423.1 hypothetical protein [Salmonella enterica subsp. enterica serovar Ball]